MSELVERAARAMRDAKANPRVNGVCDWSGLLEAAANGNKLAASMLDSYRADARAAIEAMRDPDHSVVMAAKDVIDRELLSVSNGAFSLTPNGMRLAINAGIDAALAPTEREAEG